MELDTDLIEWVNTMSIAYDVDTKRMIMAILRSTMREDLGSFGGMRDRYFDEALGRIDRNTQDYVAQLVQGQQPDMEEAPIPTASPEQGPEQGQMPTQRR